MAKHNDKKFTENLKMSFKAKLENQLKTGIAEGLYAACKVIYDKAQDETKSPEERLANITEFCMTGIRLRSDSPKDQGDE